MQNDTSKATQTPAQKQMPGKDQNVGNKPADKMSTEKKGGCGC